MYIADVIKHISDYTIQCGRGGDSVSCGNILYHNCVIKTLQICLYILFSFKLQNIWERTILNVSLVFDD